MKKKSHIYIGEEVNRSLSETNDPLTKAEAEPERLGAKRPTAIKKYKELKKLIKEYKINTCYTLTISANNGIIKAMVEDDPILFWRKWMGMFLTINNYKKCLYTIEKSNNGKYHIHGIIKSCKRINSKELKEKYRGYQIYIQRLKKGEGYLIHDDKGNIENKYFTRYTNWLKYMIKDPQKILQYEYGKNFIKYSEIYP